MIKKSSLLKLVFVGTALAVFLGFYNSGGIANPKKNITSHARELFQTNEAYYKERKSSNWEAIYNRQHPKFRKQVTLIEFINLEGRVPFKKPKPVVHVSGVPLQNEDIKTKKYISRDPLGFPRKIPYRIFPNPWITIKGRKVKKVSISPDGKYGKVETEYNIKEKLDPIMFRVNMDIDRKESVIDYWEKVEDRWVVPLMVQNVSPSGGKVVNYFSPNNLKDLEKIKFVELDLSQIK